MNKDIFIDYDALVDEAMHIIVKKSLEYVVNRSFPDEHSFFISFITTYPGVQLSEKLRKRYPNEMTIVLQYQYEDLKVNNDKFSVILSFDNQKEKIIIPFKSLTAFADPSVKFGLQFKHYIDKEENFEIKESKEIIDSNNTISNVITLDKFRNKQK